ncbi:MAG: DUF2911 domain-containing protein [Acidobacteria bacterium]|nr:DUF2911 domain-containing protein [Acidobacteriota bacterium]
MDTPRRNSRCLISIVLALVFGLTPGGALIAQEEESPEPGPLPVAEAQDFLGRWVIRLESTQGDFDADFVVKDVDGIAVAELDLGPLGEQSVELIIKTEEGIELRFEAGFGGQLFEMRMPVSREGDEIAGTLGDTNGLFKLDFTGIKESKAQELERAGERERIRSRGGRGGQDIARTSLTFGDKEVSIRFDKAKVEEPDFAQIAEIADGDVVRFVEHQSTKLRTEVTLRFGDTAVEPENVAPDYPGVYSLWLQKTSAGWHLLFNDKADVWGSQHDPDADAASVPLQFSSDNTTEAATLAIELEEADDGGSLRIVWGPYSWETRFTVDDD